jgi:YHS domain-containing protein
MNLDNSQTNPPIVSEFITACSGKIKDPSKYPSAEYKGKRIYFCTQACLEMFLQAPDPFMTGEVEHPV